MTRTEQLQDRYARVMMPNYGVPPVALAYGQGSQVWDVDGRQRIGNEEVGTHLRAQRRDARGGQRLGVRSG